MSINSTLAIVRCPATATKSVYKTRQCSQYNQTLRIITQRQKHAQRRRQRHRTKRRRKAYDAESLRARPHAEINHRQPRAAQAFVKPTLPATRVHAPPPIKTVPPPMPSATRAHGGAGGNACHV